MFSLANVSTAAETVSAKNTLPLTVRPVPEV